MTTIGRVLTIGGPTVYPSTPDYEGYDLADDLRDSGIEVGAVSVPINTASGRTPFEIDWTGRTDGHAIHGLQTRLGFGDPFRDMSPRLLTPFKPAIASGVDVIHTLGMGPSLILAASLQRMAVQTGAKMPAIVATPTIRDALRLKSQQRVGNLLAPMDLTSPDTTRLPNEILAPLKATNAKKGSELHDLLQLLENPQPNLLGHTAGYLPFVGALVFMASGELVQQMATDSSMFGPIPEDRIFLVRPGYRVYEKPFPLKKERIAQLQSLGVSVKQEGTQTPVVILIMGDPAATDPEKITVEHLDELLGEFSEQKNIFFITHGLPETTHTAAVSRPDGMDDTNFFAALFSSADIALFPKTYRTGRHVVQALASGTMTLGLKLNRGHRLGFPPESLIAARHIGNKKELRRYIEIYREKTRETKRFARSLAQTLAWSGRARSLVEAYEMAMEGSDSSGGAHARSLHETNYEPHDGIPQRLSFDPDMMGQRLAELLVSTGALSKTNANNAGRVISGLWRMERPERFASDLASLQEMLTRRFPLRENNAN